MQHIFVDFEMNQVSRKKNPDTPAPLLHEIVEIGAVKLDGEYRQLDQDFTQRKMEGMTVLDALAFEQCLRAMEAKIRRETQVLEELRQKEEAKRAEVVVAKQDTSALEKLREKKLDNYNKMVQKAEESMIDELVSTKRVMAVQTA